VIFFLLHFFTPTILLFEVCLALPYDWKTGVSGTVTRCFESKEVVAECEDFSEPGAGNKKFFELQISAKDFMRKKFTYSYEKAIEGDLCKQHLRKIKSLMSGSPEVCVTGFAEWANDSDISTSAKWDALETAKGRVVW